MKTEGNILSVFHYHIQRAANFVRFVMSLNTLLVGLASFGTYSLIGYVLDASVAFPALSLFNILQFPLSVLPRQLNSIVQVGYV